MIRAAAKNSDVRGGASWTRRDYERVLAELRESGGRLSLRDAQSARREGVRVHRALRRGDLHLVRGARAARASRRRWSDAYEKVSDLRYGENPHQQRRLLRARRAPRRTCSPASSSCTARSCRSTTCSTSAPHASWSRSSTSPPARSSSTTTRAAAPSATSGREAYERAFACDPQSAYGGVIAVNRPVDARLRGGARQAVHRGAARARLRRRRAGGAAGQEERAPARAARLARAAARGRSQARDRRPARADAATSSQRRASRCA